MLSVSLARLESCSIVFVALGPPLAPFLLDVGFKIELCCMQANAAAFLFSANYRVNSIEVLVIMDCY